MIRVLFLLCASCACLVAKEPLAVPAIRASFDSESIERRVVALAVGKPDYRHVRGTAFLVGPRGLLATAEHAILDEKKEVVSDIFVLRLVPPATIASPVKVVKRFERGRDLALLQIAVPPGEPDLPFFEIGEGPRIGEEIFIAGYPLVFDAVYRWPLFRFGRISSVRYHLRESKVLVLDLISASGFSGAPLLRMSDGRVLGVQKGGATGNAQAGFSLATELYAADLMLVSPATANPNPEPHP